MDTWWVVAGGTGWGGKGGGEMGRGRREGVEGNGLSGGAGKEEWSSLVTGIEK